MQKRNYNIIYFIFYISYYFSCVFYSLKKSLEHKAKTINIYGGKNSKVQSINSVVWP